jgi:RNA polymerase sigma factor (sigma-70 family)
MTTGTWNPTLRQLRKAVLLPDGAGLSDGQLLEAFVGRQDEAAFAALVRRHGPMVLGVCRRVLRHHHDAEDAFQATFLVLARKAGSVLPRDLVANWLYGVAYRTALKARTVLARRRERERQVAEMPEPEAAAPDGGGRDWQPLLDQELRRLPDKYRVPVVLCDLEGKTGKEAAHQLGWPEGTIASRLSRGRGLLAKRLARHGLALSGAALAAAFSQGAAAAVPTSLASDTVKAAGFLAAGRALTPGLVSAEVAALAEGVVSAMFVNKVKIAVVVFAVLGIVGAGMGGMPFRVAADDQPVVRGGGQSVAPAGGSQGDKRADDRKAPGKNSAQEALDLVLKGYQAYWDSQGQKPAEQDLARLLWEVMEKSYRPPDGKQATLADKEALAQYKEAFLLAFQISSEIARRRGKVAAEGQKPVEQDLARLLWEVMEKSYRPPGGRQATPADKEALAQYKEAFLLAFRLSAEMAKARGKDRVKAGASDAGVFGAVGSAFVRAYAQAGSLKKTLAGQKAADGKAAATAVAALDDFLKAGKEFEQVVRGQAKDQAVAQVKKEIEGALRRLGETEPDRRAQFEALEEIERLIRDLKEKVRQK